jgi:hypothetical protein
MTVNIVYRVEVTFDARPEWDDISDRVDEVTDELHGLAAGSITCESFSGNPAFSPGACAEFESLAEATGCDLAWTRALTEKGFIIQERS